MNTNVFRLRSVDNSSKAPACCPHDLLTGAAKDSEHKGRSVAFGMNCQHNLTILNTPQVPQHAQNISAILNYKQYKSRTTIERLVFSGGGAKGGLYGGVYKALHDLGIIPEIKEISGVSVGAIVAALAATGANLTAINAIASKDINDLLGAEVKNHTKKPGVVKVRGFIKTKDGAPMLKLLRSTINNAVKENISNLLSQHLINNIKSRNLAMKLLKKTKDFTFADLADLHHICPEKFKKLSVIAIKYPEGTQQIFNNTLTPQLSIALACRASSSIPLILEPVKIKIQNKYSLFMDGGYFDNIPTEIFDKSSTGNFDTNNKKNQTLTFAFERSYKIDFKEWLLRDVMVKTLSGLKANYSNTARKAATFSRLNKLYKDNTVELYHPHKMKSQDFTIARKNKEIIEYLGYVNAMEQILEQKFHKNELKASAFYREISKNFANAYNSPVDDKIPKNSNFIKQLQVLITAKERFIFIRNYINKHLKDSSVKKAFIASVDAFKNKYQLLSTNTEKYSNII